MLEYAERVLRMVDGRTRTEMDTDLLLPYALTRCLEVIGEAANQLTPTGRERVPDIPWPSIINMRHRLIHAYYDINHDVLWLAATERIPELIAALRPVVDAMDTDG